MIFNKPFNRSFLVSIIIHVVLLTIFFFFKITLDYPTPEFVEVGFGNLGEASSSGAKSSNVKKMVQPVKEKKVERAEKAAKVVKKVDLPETKNTEEQNIATRAETKKEERKEPSEKAEPSSEVAKENPTTKAASNEGSGITGESNGSFGYDIDWGGKGMRRIYSYRLPNYPEGVSKEIDVKLKFTILPDGTVGTIRPLIKADSKLEAAAINSLRQWRFEPLRSNQQQSEQTAVIIFPYRLQ